MLKTEQYIMSKEDARSELSRQYVKEFKALWDSKKAVQSASSSSTTPPLKKKRKRMDW